MKKLLLLLVIPAFLIGCDASNPLVQEYLKVHEDRQQVVPVVDPEMDLVPYTIERQIHGDGEVKISRSEYWEITSNVDLAINYIHAEKAEAAGVTIESSNGIVLDLHGHSHARRNAFGRLTIRTPILPNQVHDSDGFIGYNIRNEDGDLLMEVRYKE